MTKREGPVIFRPGDLASSLDARHFPGGAPANRNEVAQRDLDRYYALLERALKEINLTENEAMLILDAVNGHWFTSHSIAGLPYQITEVIQDAGLDQKWKANADNLIQRLGSTTYLQRLAIADACERYWIAVGRGEDPTPLSVGLHRENMAAG